MKEKLIVVIGPTAVGKTKVSIELAKALETEIISGDSMQIYKGMDIGTAKVTPEEMEGIPHHLIDILDPTDTFSVAQFQELAQAHIHRINKNGKIPIIAGGTGLYVQSVLYDYQFSEAGSDEEWRTNKEKEAKEKGNTFLHDKLRELDPLSASEIHPNNVRRVIRALEIIEKTGQKASDVSQEQNKKSSYDYVLIGLNMDRKMLYERINQRVDMMMEQGLLQEVERLYNQGIRNCPSIQAIGYKELYTYLEGNCTLEEAIETLKRNSRRYAKRQLTWFRNKMDVTWFLVNEGTTGEKVREILDFIAGKLDQKAK